jgi:hypothetical protein
MSVHPMQSTIKNVKQTLPMAWLFFLLCYGNLSASSFWVARASYLNIKVKEQLMVIY